MRIPDAVACVCETLDLLRRREDLTVVYSLPMTTVPPNIPAADAQHRRAEFARGIESCCAEKRIPCLDPDAARLRAGGAPALAGDRWHPDIANRRLDAGIVADSVLRALEGATSFEPGVEGR
jgi:hypothetical protein